METNDTTLKKLQVVLTGNTAQLQSAMSQAEAATKKATDGIQSGLNSVSNTIKSVAKVAATYISVKALVNFGKSCVQLGSDLTEVQNVVDTTFGSMSSAINDFASTAIDSFGISETAAKKYSSTMGAMLKSMGVNMNSVTDMSTTLAGLAGDLASFYNIDADTAFAKIRSGISGETEPLKQLGINLSVANLEAYALSQGITKSYSAMTQAEQAVLRYNYLLNATKDAQGDAARTSGEWAGQMRTLSMRFDQIKATLGQGLIYALTPVIQFINSLLEKLQELANKFKIIMAVITGQDLTAVASTGASTALSDDMADVSASADNASDSVDGITDSMKDANKEVKSFLLSFDEIHKLGSSDDDKVDLTKTSTDTAADSVITPEGIAGINDGTEAVDDFNNSLGMSNEEIDALKQRLQPVINFIQGVKDGVGSLINEAKRIWDEVSPELIAVWQNDIEPNLSRWGEKISELWNDHLKGFFQNVGDAISALWHNILEPFIKWFAEQGFDKVIDTVEDLVDTGGGILGVVTGLFNTAVGDLKYFAADALGWGDVEDAQQLIEQGQYQMATGAHQSFKGVSKLGSGITDTLGITEGQRDWVDQVMNNTTPIFVDSEAYKYYDSLYGHHEDKSSSSGESKVAESVDALNDTLSNWQELEAIEHNSTYGETAPTSAIDNQPMIDNDRLSRQDFTDAMDRMIEALTAERESDVIIDGVVAGTQLLKSYLANNMTKNPEVQVV